MDSADADTSHQIIMLIMYSADADTSQNNQLGDKINSADSHNYVSE